MSGEDQEWFAGKNFQDVETLHNGWSEAWVSTGMWRRIGNYCQESPGNGLLESGSLLVASFPMFVYGDFTNVIVGDYTMEISNQLFFMAESWLNTYSHTTAWQEFTFLKLWLFLHESYQTVLPMKAPFSLLSFLSYYKVLPRILHILLFLLFG